MPVCFRLGRGKVALLEPLALFAAILAYIWTLRFAHPGLWAPILAAMLISHLLRGEGAAALGITSRDLAEDLRRFAPALGLAALALVAAGMLGHSMRQIGLDDALLSLGAYLPWGVFQQYLLNGYFGNRLAAALPQRAASMAAAALFSGAHAPNAFLMAVTLVAGYCSTRVYRRYPNLYFLGLMHAAVGFLLFLVVPDSVSHHLNVGPGFYRHCGGARPTPAQAVPNPNTAEIRLPVLGVVSS